jgi:pilus assembly protein CpaF
MAEPSQPVPAPNGQQRPGQPQGRFIVVFGTKGGVGKTVVATNVAASLAQRIRKPVCLVDLDMIAVGDACKMLGVTATRSIVDLMPVLRKALQAAPAGGANGYGANGDPGLQVPLPIESHVVPHASGVHVLTALTNPRQMNQMDAKALPVLFSALKRRYDYVIVDGGKTFYEPLIAAFDAANLILLVASPDVITLYQTKWALGLVESLMFPSSMVKAVLNRADSRGGVETKDVRVAIPCEVIGQIPSDGHAVGTAVNQGIPVVTAYGSSKVATAFQQLADALVTRSDLYIAHHEVSRHRQQPKSGDKPVAEDGVMWSTRLYETENEATDESIDEIVLLKRRIHEKLVEELDLKRQDISFMTNNTQLTELRNRTERVIANLLAKEIGGIASSREVHARLVKEIADEALGLGPLEELLADPQISDILVNNKDQIYVERRGRLELTNRKFVSNDLVRAVIERIIAPLGRRIDESSPMVDARLPDGSRVNAIIPPLSLKGPALSIRKFSRVRYTGQDLIEFGSLTADILRFIQACVISKKNMIISGGTGSGKTTFLNVISMAIPEGERIITIEDAAELQLSQTHWLNLESRPQNVEGKGQILIRDLFRNALRMRPDRIIVGECRGNETLDMLQAMNTGHQGSLTTVHANSPKDAVTRLDSMVLMSNVELPIRAIREMISSAINVIIHTSRLPDGSRKIMAVSELMGLEDHLDVKFQDIFVFRQTGTEADGTVLGEFVTTGLQPSFFHELETKGIDVDASLFEGKAVPARINRRSQPETRYA